MGEPTSATAPTDRQGPAGQQLTAGAAPASWRGVLRQDGRQVWSCRHQHGSTAQACASADRDLLALYGVTGAARQALIHTAREARRLGSKASPADRGPKEPGQ